MCRWPLGLEAAISCSLDDNRCVSLLRILNPHLWSGKLHFKGGKKGVKTCDQIKPGGPTVGSFPAIWHSSTLLGDAGQNTWWGNNVLRLKKRIKVGLMRQLLNIWFNRSLNRPVNKRKTKQTNMKSWVLDGRLRGSPELPWVAPAQEL